MKLAAFLVLTACGRIDFGPIVPTGDDAPGDGRQRDGKPVDTELNACAASATMVTAGVPTTINTCVDPDRLDGCGPANSKEAILEFIAPMSGSYTARAYDHGTTNITVSTMVLDNACANGSSCAGILGLDYTIGVPVYFLLEPPGGGSCADVDFLVD